MVKYLAPFIVAFLTLPESAHAEWQYTKWGMTPAQVVAASKGAAILSTGLAEERYAGADIRATGVYTSGHYRFRTVFYFVDGKLADIRLKLQGENHYNLKNDLLGVYGTPFKESVSLRLTTWHDTKKNNRVDLLIIGDSHTTLEYRPLKSESAGGL